MVKASVGRCAITPMNGLTLLGLRFTQRRRNREERNDKPKKDTSINTRSLNLLGAW
jgi:hypothetical protein